MISAPATDIHPAAADAFNTKSHQTEGLSESDERENTTCLSGFIFLCNQSTKYECYRYRVFGLPLGRKKVVEEIKPGTKLFLFDFELRRLYGVYEATSAGNLYLEPEAFGGKYPAQVKFRIFKECLPILENSLKSIIKENYTGKKFKQELTGTQVTKLISSFRPLLASQALPNKYLPVAMPPSVMENQLKHKERLPVKDDSYSAGGQYSHIQPSVELKPTLSINYRERGSYISNIRRAISSYGAHPRPSSAEDVARGVQEPSYSRYTTLERRASHDVLGRQYNQLPLQREAFYQNSVAAIAYNSNSTAKDPYIPSALLTQPYASHHQFPHHSSNRVAPSYHTTSGSHEQVPAAYLPVQSEALHQDNVAAYNSTATDHYTPSVVQTQPYPSYHQLVDHSSNSATPAAATSGSHQDNVAAYNSNSTATDQYIPSVMQTQLYPSYHQFADHSSNSETPAAATSGSHQDNVAAYNSNSTATDQYAPSVMQTQPYASYHQNSDHSCNHANLSDLPQVLATYPPLQTEAHHQDSATQCNYNLMALAQCASSVFHTQVPVHYGQPHSPGAQYATYLPQQTEVLYQRNAVSYYSNPTVPVQYGSIPQSQVSAMNLPLQSEALCNVATYNSNPVVGDQYIPSGGRPEVLGHAVADGSAPTASYFPYSAADHPSR